MISIAYLLPTDNMKSLMSKLTTTTELHKFFYNVTSGLTLNKCTSIIPLHSLTRLPFEIVFNIERFLCKKEKLEKETEREKSELKSF